MEYGYNAFFIAIHDYLHELMNGNIEIRDILKILYVSILNRSNQEHKEKIQKGYEAALKKIIETEGVIEE